MLRQVPDVRAVSTSYVAGFAIQAVYFLALARTLGAESFGTFAAALALVTFALPFAGIGAGNVLVQEGARDIARVPYQYGVALATTAVTFPLLTIIVAIAGRVVLPSSSASLVVGLAVAELFFGRILEFSVQAFQAVERYLRLLLLVVGSRLLRLIGLIVAATVDPELSARDWVTWYLGISILVAVLAIAAVVASLGAPMIDYRGVRTLRDGVFYAVGSASKSVYADIDKVMLAGINSLTAAGIYTAAYRVVSIAVIPNQAFVYARNPALFRLGTGEAGTMWTFFRSNIRRLLSYAGCASIGICLAAPLMPILLGSSYEGTTGVLLLLALLPPIQAVHYFAGDSLMGLGRQGLRSIAQVGTAFLNVGLNLILIPLWSFNGAATATLFSEGFLALVLAYTLRRVCRSQQAASSVSSVNAAV